MQFINLQLRLGLDVEGEIWGHFSGDFRALGEGEKIHPLHNQNKKCQTFHMDFGQLKGRSRSL